MSNDRPSMGQRLATRWEGAKPVLTGLVIGLIAGPIISGFTGFQVRTSSAEAATRAGIVEQQAGFCAERALAASSGPAPTDWTARNEMARRFAVMPGTTSPDQEVVYACSNRLAR